MSSSTELRVKRWGIAAASLLLLSFALLALWHLDFAAIGAALSGADWRLIGLAAGLNLAVLYFRVFKWRFFFAPGDEPKFYHLTLAAFSAYSINNLIPAKIGIFAQVWLLGDKESRSYSQIFGTLVLLRLFDGASLAAIGLAVLWLIEVPEHNPYWPYLQKGGVLFAAVFFGLLLGLLLLRRGQWLGQRLQALSRRLARRSVQTGLVHSLARFRQGFGLLDRPRRLLWVIALNLVFWLLCSLSIFLNLSAFDVGPIDVYTPFYLLLAQALSFVIPSPGNIGPYHIATVAALSLQGVETELALSIAIVMHASFLSTNTLPGLVYLWRENLRFSDLRGRTG